MLTKSAHYYFDQDAVRVPNLPQSIERAKYPVGAFGSYSGEMEIRQPSKRTGVTVMEELHPLGRNIRSVWEFPTQPYKFAHFAVFPEKLPEICIKAATPEVGCCNKCGAPWERITDDHKQYQAKNVGGKSQLGGLEEGKRFKDRYNVMPQTLDWQPTCKCNANKVPSLVLDPFGGSGTVCWVAKKLNRKSVIYELSKEYCALAVKRNLQQNMGI